jgi:hypothetical protein
MYNLMPPIFATTPDGFANFYRVDKTCHSPDNLWTSSSKASKMNVIKKLHIPNSAYESKMG